MIVGGCSTGVPGLQGRPWYHGDADPTPALHLLVTTGARGYRSRPEGGGLEEERTLIAHIGARASREPTSMAVWGQVDHEWRRLSWALFGSSMRQAAKGLVSLGVTAGEIVAMVGGNRPEWTVAQYGAQCAGAQVAPLSDHLPAEELAARLAELSPRIVFVDTVEHLVRVDRLAAAGGHRIGRFVILDAVTTDDPRMLTLDDLMVLGASVQDDRVDERIRALEPESPALMLPEASVWRTFSHRELLELARAHAQGLGPEDRVLSQLPPSELVEQLFAFALPVLVGCPVWFIGRGDVEATWAEARPTIAWGDAAGWREHADRVREGLAAAEGVLRPLVRWAASTERQAQIEGRDGLGRRIARALVLDELRERLGLDALKRALATEPVDEASRDVLASVGVVLEPAPS